MCNPPNGDIDAMVLLKSGMPEKGICGMPANEGMAGIGGMPGIGNGEPFAPKPAAVHHGAAALAAVAPSAGWAAPPAVRHAFIQASNICCIPAGEAAVSGAASGCAASGEAALREEVVERFDAAIPALTGKS